MDLSETQVNRPLGQSTSDHVDSAPVIGKDYPTRIRTPPDRFGHGTSE